MTIAPACASILDPSARTKADRCSDYLLAKAAHLRYDHALAQGWPIATGVIEGAVRHLVKGHAASLCRSSGGLHEAGNDGSQQLSAAVVRTEHGPVHEVERLA